MPKPMVCYTYSLNKKINEYFCTKKKYTAEPRKVSTRSLKELRNPENKHFAINRMWPHFCEGKIPYNANITPRLSLHSSRLKRLS